MSVPVLRLLYCSISFGGKNCTLKQESPGGFQLSPSVTPYQISIHDDFY